MRKNRRVCPCGKWKWNVSARCWKEKSTDRSGLALGYCSHCGVRLNDDGTQGRRPRDIAAELAVYKRALVNIFKHFYADWEEQMALWLAEAAEQVDAPGGGTDEEH
jgi:hypothetical protein